MDAVDTDNLPDDVSASEIAQAASMVEEEDGPAAKVDDIPSEDPVEAAISDA